MKHLPTNEQIQSWLLAVDADPYFERLLEQPGLLILRVKKTLCQWRGLHLVMSDVGREGLRKRLSLLVEGEFEKLEFRISHPDGRAWFDLYTSGIDFASWGILQLMIEASLADKLASVHFVGDTVKLRLSKSGLQKLIAELHKAPVGGILSGLSLTRDAKPLSPMQALWLWQWTNGANAANP